MRARIEGGPRLETAALVAWNAALSLPRLLILALISVYRKAFSPAFPPRCRYYPSCSRYAYEAVEKYGALRGGFLAAKRILRCHPFRAGGYDPVP